MIETAEVALLKAFYKKLPKEGRDVILAAAKAFAENHGQENKHEENRPAEVPQVHSA
jgi:TRAP-type C4-dicarboxylate transport system substrate-binding protein